MALDGLWWGWGKAAALLGVRRLQVSGLVSKLTSWWLVFLSCSSVSPFVGYSVIVYATDSLLASWNYPQELPSVGLYI